MEDRRASRLRLGPNSLLRLQRRRSDLSLGGPCVPSSTPIRLVTRSLHSNLIHDPAHGAPPMGLPPSNDSGGPPEAHDTRQ
jgi:hypothetical protein